MDVESTVSGWGRWSWWTGLSVLYLDRDVGVVSWQDHILAFLFPLDQSHWERKDLTEKNENAARTVYLTDRWNLYDWSYRESERAEERERVSESPD